MSHDFSKYLPSGPMLSISWNIRVCVHVCACLFTFEVPFKRLFAPTSQSRMSKNFRDLESLGKSNGKKRSQIWTVLLIKGVKSPRQKNFVFGWFFLYWAGFCWYWCFSLCLTVFLPPLPKVQCPKKFNFQNPRGKIMKRSGLRLENFCS